MDEIGEFVRSGLFADLQEKVEGWILRLSRFKAVHFLPGNTPQGWEDFYWFCRIFTLLRKPNPDKLKYYFLIQLPS